VTGTSPTIRQRELGKRLRDLRSEHDLTVEDVAQKLLCSATKVSRLETGARRPSLRDVRDLCLLYGVDETTSTELMSLARGAREQGWWTQYEDLDLDPYIGLEQEATAITC
jgi:transcriptional regulator with XRE-family HTH domain